MPFQPIVPTWTAWNNANFTSPTALTDVRTGLPFAAGGLNLGDFFDATEQEANTASYTTNGLLHSGRYRYVQVSAAATTGNVAVGKVGYIQPGNYVQTVVTLTQGSGQTPGTYVVTATGGGSPSVQATLQVVVVSATSVVATLLTPGYGYTSAPTFTLASGGTPATFAAELAPFINVVTSFDVNAVGPRPVVFLNSITPGNYGFVQELGVATVLGYSSITAATIGNFVITKASGAGTVDAVTSPTQLTVGQALDLPLVSALFKVILNGPVVQD